MTSRRTNASNHTGFDAFMIIRFQIDLMLERAKALSGARFESNPDEIRWGATLAT